MPRLTLHRCLIATTLLSILLAASPAQSSPRRFPQPGHSPASSLSVTPSSLTFATQPTLTHSPVQRVTLTNTGASSIQLASLASPPNFTLTDLCPSVLTAGSSCTVDVEFSPAKSGPLVATLSLHSSTPGISATIGLSGVASDPIGRAQSKSITCPPGGISGNCYALRISCPSIATSATTALKVSTPSGTSIGTVIFTTGDGGIGFYDSSYMYGQLAVQNVLNANYTVVQLSYSNLPYGWLQGPGGPRALACRYATASEWVYQTIQKQNTSIPMCATGGSAGGAEITYAIAHYGLDSIFSLAEPTSGPPLARVDSGCICLNAPVQTPCGQGAIAECYGIPTAQSVIDPTFHNHICSQAVRSHNQRNQALFLDDSVDAADALYSYPHTYVRQLLGGQDNTSAVPQGVDYFNNVTSQKSQACVADAPHGIADVLDGAEQISNDVITYCKLH